MGCLKAAGIWLVVIAFFVLVAMYTMGVQGPNR